jgi:hypothetical protein
MAMAPGQHQAALLSGAKIPIWRGAHIITALGAGRMTLEEAQRDLRAIAGLYALPPDVEAEVSEALESLEDRGWRI